MNKPSIHQIDRIEPPFWFAGMIYSELQIMFYGNRISEYEIEVSNHVLITNITKTPNHNYIFVTIETKKLDPQEILFSFIKKDHEFTQKYELKSRRENSVCRKSYNSSDLIYLLMPDRFACGNPNKETDETLLEKTDRNLPTGRHGGDIDGIIQHLDYLEELGVTAILATPFCENNVPDFSYHGYSQTDVYKIDPRFGDNEDYCRLSTELHNRNMKLIMDYVINHWGLEHWMLKDLPTNDWINNFSSYAQTNFKMTTQFDSNASKIDTSSFTDGWFTHSMPDLNQSNPLVLNYLIQNAIWWIEYADLDGFRVDTYSYCDKHKIAQWSKAITTEYPNFNLSGEIWLQDRAQIAYWQKDSKLAAIQNYNSELPSVMDFPLMDILRKVFNSSDIEPLYEHFTNDFLYPNINNLLIFAENHDITRFNEIYRYDFQKYKLVMIVLATVRGIPKIYYGSEISMGGSREQDGDSGLRRDFPGGWIGDENNAFLSQKRSREQQIRFEFTSKLFHWRKKTNVIHSGKTKHYVPENNIYVYFRYNETQSVMVVINNFDEEQTFQTQRFKESFLNYNQGVEILTDKIIDLSHSITIEKKTAMILELLVVEK